VFFYYSSILFALLPYVPSILFHILKWFFLLLASCLLFNALRLFGAAHRLRFHGAAFLRFSGWALRLAASRLFSPLRPRRLNIRLWPSSPRPATCTLFFLMVLIFFLSTYVQSAQVTIQWDPNLEGDVAGYKVYYGTSSGQYQSSIDVGKTTLCTLSSLQDEIPYYFAATAYDTARAESNFSSEIVYGGGGGCAYSLSAGSQSFSSSGGAGTVSLTTSSECSWSAVSNAAWVIISSNSSGSGTGSVAYSVTSNLTSSSRSGTLTIGGKTFTVNQAGGACTYSLSPSGQSFTAAGGTGTLTVSAPSGCSWNASSQAGWIAIQSGSTGTGNGTTTYTVASCSGDSSRTGTLTVAGALLTVTQLGVSQYSLSVNKTGTGSGSVSTVPASTVFSQGTGVTLTASPDSNSTFAGWSGGCSGISPACSLTMNASVAVTAAFNLKTFTIAATAGANGSMSPQGSLSVNYGASQGFTITPAAGYGIRDVKVDGNSIGAPTTYLFGNVSASHTISATFAALPSPAPADFVLAVNAGGEEYTDRAGAGYLADRYFGGGAVNRIDAPIQGAANPVLYQTERYGKFSYALPVPNGSYDVTLRFVENTYTAKNQRVFDVYVEGKLVLSSLDIYAVSGQNTALDFTFTVSAGDGALNFDFLPRTGEAQVSAILVMKASGSNKHAPGKVKRFYTTQAKTD
jgi:hypothetical protein